MIYEVGYLILPTIGEEGVAPEVSKLKETLASVEAKVIADEYPVLISLQYEMEKRIDTKNVRFNQGFFGWIKFEAEGKDVESIKKQMDLNKAILRYMIISTVRENTISSKKPLASTIVSRSSRSPKATVEEALPLDKEAVDQEIDRLVEGVSDEVVVPEVSDTKE
jgi:ribosomal protein S6